MATAPKKQEIAKVNEAAISQSQPGYLDQYKGQANQDNFDSSDVVMPRIKLLQGLSKEVETFDAAKAGLFWHTGFDVSLGDTVKFVVCARKKKFLLTAPIDDGQGVLARADDFITWDRLGRWDIKIKGKKKPVQWEITDANVEKSGLANWGTYDPEDEDSPPAATLFYEYLVLLPDHLDLGPVMLSLARSQIKKAKKGLNDKIALHSSAGRPMQALVFEMKSVVDNSPSGDFKNFHFSGLGFASEPLFLRARTLEGALNVRYRVQGEEGIEEGAEYAAKGGKASESKEY